MRYRTFFGVCGFLFSYRNNQDQRQRKGETMMIREYLQWSKSKNEIVRFILWNDPPKQYHSIVHRSKGQNEMRRVLSALQKTKRHGISIIPNNHEMYIHRENGGYYSLWVYTDNWQGWASFLAGVLVGKGVI